MKTLEEWLLIFSEKFKSESQLKEDIEKKIETFAYDMLSKDGPLQNTFKISSIEMEQLYNDAYKQYKSGNNSEAMRLFHLLIILNPSQRKYWMGLGASLQLLKKYEDAARCYAIVSFMDACNPYPHYHAFECLSALGHKAEAKNALEVAEKYASTSPFYVNLLTKIREVKDYVS